MKAEWKTTQDIEDRYQHASFIGNSRVVLNIGGDRYRSVTHIHFDYRIAYVKFVGTRAEYDRVDAEST